MAGPVEAALGIGSGEQDGEDLPPRAVGRPLPQPIADLLPSPFQAPTRTCHPSPMCRDNTLGHLGARRSRVLQSLAGTELAHSLKAV